MRDRLKFFDILIINMCEILMMMMITMNVIRTIEDILMMMSLFTNLNIHHQFELSIVNIQEKIQHIIDINLIFINKTKHYFLRIVFKK